MDLFGFGGFYDGYGYGRNHWYGSKEKSKHSKGREDESKKKFDTMQKTMETTMIETTVNEERGKMNSHLRSLPVDALNNVYGYLLGKEFEKDENADVSRQLAKAAPYIQPSARTSKTVGDKTLQFGIDFSDLTLYEPGNKITIPLTMPHFHLTQPCFRDLKKHVVKSTGWDLKRVACTDAEKKKHKVTRKSKAYFVNAIYKVPGTPKKKSKKKTSKKNASTSASASAPAAKKNASAPTKKRAATATKATKKPIYKANPVATAALQAALDSAQDGDGVVDPKCLKKALAQGYSKVYIDAKVDERIELNVKPAAKKMKTEL